jgi:ribosomal protein S18 acetylase RimI-like enzyme
MAHRIFTATAADAATIARIVSASNRDVALAFGLDADNCPKHPSFCTPARVDADLQRGETYFLLAQGGDPVACVAYETPNAEVAYLNRLSVLPAARRQGLGERLVAHILERARSDARKTVSIGVIGEHAALQDWYRKQGFSDGETKRFPHLPFSVKYMACAVGKA